jgi:3-oxoacyl-[acyl-carrier-protein] synthase-3
MNSGITHIDYYLPECVLTNEDLALEFPDWSAKKIESKIGIRQRHIVGKNETALDLAYCACEQLFLKIDKNTVDFVILCTQSPDYFLPTSACILQNRLGLKTSIGAFDFNLGCSGFVYGLALAKGLIGSDIAKNVLLVTSETYTKHLHKLDKGNRTIFGDGAAATLVSSSSESKIHAFALGTDGSGFENLIINNGGLRSPNNPDAQDWIDDAGNVRNDNNLYMNGPDIFNFTIEAVPKLVEETLTKNNKKLEEVDYFIFHQANQYMLKYLRDIVGIPEEKFYINLLNTGNTVSATIPIALKDALDHGLVKTGKKVLLAGFGVGYSYGATIITI